MAEEVAEAEAEPDQFAVLPENWDAVQIFQHCCRNWIYKGLEDKPEGLDVTAIISVLSLYSLTLTPEQKRGRLSQVQLIELGALSVMNPAAI